MCICMCVCILGRGIHNDCAILLLILPLQVFWDRFLIPSEIDGDSMIIIIMVMTITCTIMELISLTLLIFMISILYFAALSICRIVSHLTTAFFVCIV